MEIIGIITKQSEYKDNDLLVNILNNEGKIGVVCRGANKITSKNGASLFPFSLVSMQINDTNNKGLLSLKSAETKNSHSHIIDDINKNPAASIMCEYAEYLSTLNASASYELLGSGLDELDLSSDPLMVLLVFLAKLTHLFGIDPCIDTCVKCGSEKKLCTVSIFDGGFVCEDCFDYKTKKMSKEFLLLFRIIHKADINQSSKIVSTDELKIELLEFMFNYLEEHSGFYVKGKKLLLCLLHS